MTRPRRHEDRTVRLVAYVAPLTLAAFTVQAELAGVSLGVILDGYANSGPVIKKSDVVNPIETLSPLRNHVWKDHPTFGKVCGACKKPKRTAEGTNCVPIDDISPETASNAQKGPK